MMRRLGYQLLREWWEWRPIILSGLALVLFLGFLMLFQIGRSLDHFQARVQQEGVLEFGPGKHFLGDSSGVKVEWQNHSKADSIYIWFRWEENKGLVTGTTPKQQRLLERKFLHVSLFMVRAVLQGTLILLLFLLTIYFAESLYRERLNNSTFFFRSLPLSDHFILITKILAGGLGFIVLALVFSSLGMGYLVLYSWIGERQLHLPLTLWWRQLDFLNLYSQWLVFLLTAVVWSLPYFTFLLAVSAYVRSRPLWFGVGLPALFSIAWRFLFGDTSLLKPVLGFLSSLNELWGGNWRSIWQTMPGEPVRLLDSFIPALFSWHSVLAILIAGGIYWVTWYAYRLNRSPA